MRAEKARRRREAEERQEKRNQRSAQEQLDLLISRGHGHCKEAEKLRLQIEEEKK